MDIYKQYIYKLRLLALRKPPYIYLLNDDIIPKCKEYIQRLNSIKFEEGSYHTYYGELKAIVNSYNIYWTDLMDDAIKEADRCTHCSKLADLKEMALKTIEMLKVKQADFESEFRPFNSPFEELVYDEIVEKHTSFMKDMEEFTANLKRLDKQNKVDAFAKEHFAMSLKRKNDVFVFTYNFISYILSLVADNIRISIEEIFDRLRTNLRSIREQSDASVSNLLISLYEKNKEHLKLSRLDHRASTELAEVQRGMEIIKDKIEDSKQLPIQRLEEEYRYWEERMREFQRIHSTINKLQDEERRVLDQQKLYHSMKDDEIPAPKQKCWAHMGEKLNDKLQEIYELKLNAAKALQTFFSVRGADRIFYSDNIGRYYVDEYGHQCYVFNYGLSVYHVNCKGEFVDVPDKEYFYDSVGRFYVDKDTQEKMYQIAPCCSSYKLQNDAFVKHTKDCGHSERRNEQCRMLVRDPTPVVMLPPIEPVDIKENRKKTIINTTEEILLNFAAKLDPEVVKYLWDTFGYILPDVLYEVAEAQPKNPIHTLAHKLLLYKYKRTNDEHNRKKEEADMYRDRIYQDRLEKASTTYKIWKKKQTRPRKSDEIDDAEENLAFNSYVAKQDFMRSLINYDN